MSTLLTLFKASKTLYQDFENSRLLNNIPFARSQKAFKLSDDSIPDPKEDIAITEFINKLAQDADVEKTTHLKNLVLILEACSAKTDTATLQTTLTTLREENKTLFDMIPSYSIYAAILDDHISHQITLEQAQKEVTLNAELTLNRDKLLGENTILLQRNGDLEKLKVHRQQAIAGLLKDIDQLQAIVESLEAKESDLAQELNATKYNLSELERNLAIEGTAHMETDAKLADAEMQITQLKKQREKLVSTHQNEVELLKVTIGMHKGVNDELKQTHSQATVQFEHAAADLRAEVAGLKNKLQDQEAELVARITTQQVTAAALQRDLQAELDSTKARAAASKLLSETQLTAAKSETQTVKQQLETKLAEVKANAATSLAALTTMADKVKAQLESKLKEQEVSMTSANKRSAELQKTLDATKTAKSKFQAAADDTMEKLHTVQSALTEKDKELADFKKKTDTEWKAKNQQSSAEIKTLTAELAQVSKAAKTAETSLAWTTDALEKFKTTREAAKKSYLAMQTKLKESENARAGLEEINATVQRSYDSLKAEYGELKNDYNGLKITSDSASNSQADAAQQAEKIKKLEQEVAVLSASRTALSAQLAKLQGRPAEEKAPTATASVAKTSQTLFAAKKPGNDAQASTPKPQAVQQKLKK